MVINVFSYALVAIEAGQVSLNPISSNKCQFYFEEWFL
jgi:hypothetical protein